jgi:hypothetical protein
MTDEEIIEFVNLVEKTWLENLIARNYLKDHCGISDPTEFLKAELQKIPPDALVHSLFAPVRQAIGQGLQDTESFERLRKVLLESLKPLKD